MYKLLSGLSESGTAMEHLFTVFKEADLHLINKVFIFCYLHHTYYIRDNMV